MSTGYHGTLWQSMPPRCQWTRQQYVFQRQPWDPMYVEHLTPPKTTCSREFNERVRLQPQKQAFPERTSVYIRNLKHQKKINSARRRIIDDPSIVSYPPVMRTNTAPQISDLNFTHTESLDKSQTGDIQKTAKRLIPVKNVAPFLKTDAEDTAKERVKEYIVNSTENAVMYIDRDKILYFRNSKSDLPQLLNFKTEDSYIAHLRKEFISQTKCAQRARRITSTVKERIDYNNRVSHILDYYEKGDAACRRMHKKENASETCEQRGERCQSTRAGTRSETPRSSPPSKRSKSSSSVRLRSLLSGPQISDKTRREFPDTVQEWQMYLKVNVQSVLHDREYLWQTPGDHSRVKPSDVISCECRMCRLEMGLPLSARIPRSVRVQKEYRDASEVLNDLSQVSFGDEPIQLGEADSLSADGSLVSANFEIQDFDSTKQAQVVRQENSDTTNKKRGLEKGKIKINSMKIEMENGQKKEERQKDEIPKQKTEKDIDLKRQTEWRGNVGRNEEHFFNEQTRKDSEYASNTLPDVVRINSGDSSVRVPDNSPTPGDLPYEEEA